MTHSLLHWQILGITALKYFKEVVFPLCSHPYPAGSGGHDSCWPGHPVSFRPVRPELLFHEPPRAGRHPGVLEQADARFLCSAGSFARVPGYRNGNTLESPAAAIKAEL